MENEGRESKKYPVYSGNYNPVSVNVDNTVGVVVLGVLAVALLIALLRAEARARKQREQSD